jgi:hypothetical protein
MCQNCPFYAKKNTREFLALKKQLDNTVLYRGKNKSPISLTRKQYDLLLSNLNDDAQHHTSLHIEGVELKLTGD